MKHYKINLCILPLFFLPSFVYSCETIENVRCFLSDNKDGQVVSIVSDYPFTLWFRTSADISIVGNYPIMYVKGYFSKDPISVVHFTEHPREEWSISNEPGALIGIRHNNVIYHFTGDPTVDSCVLTSFCHSLRISKISDFRRASALLSVYLDTFSSIKFSEERVLLSLDDKEVQPLKNGMSVEKIKEITGLLKRQYPKREKNGFSQSQFMWSRIGIYRISQREIFISQDMEIHINYQTVYSETP